MFLLIDSRKNHYIYELILPNTLGGILPWRRPKSSGNDEMAEMADFSEADGAEEDDIQYDA